VTRENRTLLVALAVVLAVAFAFVFSNVAANHEPKPHGVPLGVVGSSQSVEALTARLERSAPGSFELHAYTSPEAARTAMLHRKVYGAVETGLPPRLLVASAASAAVARMLEQTFGAAIRSQGQTLPVEDVVPLPSSDSSGATAFSAVLSLTLVGIVGTAIVYVATQHRPLEVRLAALGAVAVGAGLMAALATNVIVGAFPRHFLAVWAVTALRARGLTSGCRGPGARWPPPEPWPGFSRSWCSALPVREAPRPRSCYPTSGESSASSCRRGQGRPLCATSSTSTATEWPTP
jgi:hypothetical protein